MIVDASTLLPSLMGHPRVDLSKSVTPIERLPNLSENLG
ncbi:MAG: 1-aminocyclopropane-1-carboxylate deaminase, partial [Patiriisocius sp.]